ncbi:tyrosine-type recombinase/integrase [Paraburkholderia megapolitana]|uniref:Uncharacterized protein n=1 Tax=Paraburkholderia megapolitana TaxID=420953 RepID=A0A1I3UP33_9BURK|nr:integrase arm-type DNA-binding domain-containing protein [Paraburkholderia megapolitana]SFJ84493.1 protein of unknown function [Paraburkholderia megapolitana]
MSKFALTKLWRWKYCFDGKKRLSFGRYPDVSLKDARTKRDDARKLVADDVDPSAHKKAVKAAMLERVANTFEDVAREWFARMMTDKAKSHKDKVIARIENDIFAWLGKRPISVLAAYRVARDAVGWLLARTSAKPW